MVRARELSGRQLMACRTCGGTVPFDSPLIPELIREAERDMGFQARVLELLVAGTCRRCQDAERLRVMRTERTKEPSGASPQTPLGRWLEAFRLGRRMQKQEFARLLGLSLSRLYAVEHGVNPVPEGMLERIQDIFDLDPASREALTQAKAESRRAERH